MDNVTHSLIGLIAGESIARLPRVTERLAMTERSARESPAGRESLAGVRVRQRGLAPDGRRGLFVALCVIGGNLPDLDLLYSFRGSARSAADKLLYMLQHRGYTHTVVGCVLLALLLYGAAELWVRSKRIMLTSRDRWELAGVALFGTLLHLAMDFLNSYGVHPFWPFEDRWFYGDSVFIVEPLYWAAAAPLLFVVRSKAARIILALASLAGVILSLFSPLVPPLPRIAFLVATVALLAVGSRASPRVATLVSVSVMLLVTAAFIAAGQVATHRIESIVAGEVGTDRVIDHVLTPLPMNPFCWDFLWLATDGGRYRVRHGVLAAAPALLVASRCPVLSGNRPATAPLAAVGTDDSAQVHWLGQFDMSTAQLAAIVAAHCDAAALMQFARAPFVTQLDRRWVMGDLRFDRARGGGMATIELGPASHSSCPRSAPWIPPRLDLLREAGALRLQPP